MKTCHWITRFSAAAAVALASHAAWAGPVTLNLQGHVSGYEFIDLGPLGLGNGAAVNLSLTFNETWSDTTYDFSDPIGPVSGSMTVGALSFTFNDGTPFSYSSNIPAGDVNWVQPQFLGIGPSLGGGDFYGLFAQFTTGLALVNDLTLGYGFTTIYPEGISVTSYGYARITADSYTVTPADANAVPAPATLPLVAAALLAVGCTRRRVGTPG
jgi:hypothetical protein